MSALIDMLHLLVIGAGVTVGVWALIGLRDRLPGGRCAGWAHAAWR